MPGMRIEMPSFWCRHLIGHGGVQSRIDARVGGERRSADGGLHMQHERPLSDGSFSGRRRMGGTGLRTRVAFSAC